MGGATAGDIQEAPWYKRAWDWTYSTYEKVYVISNREPLLTIRRVVWVVTAGWVLFLLYVGAALAMLPTIVFMPFIPKTIRFAILALDTITVEHYVPAWEPGVEPAWSNNPVHPFCIVANVVWLIFFGWGFALAHLAAAVVQALTIVNISSAFTSAQLAIFALWPFGQDIRRRFLPTTVEELHEHEALEARLREPLAPEHSGSGDDAV
mmetsp:Transcript_7547/g.22322  ORF Transcript_7547/g.22322 Transcript_7547/m.22322 type:complete len:208 (-) Transcript_7547:569-1192(-)|eukprot:CAMPEP_0206140706 /NCGR_PEP_ID=MMETSP1473-20131121/10385_1 /ASSEMBLY_ACC=CAM_ASM_001109 /TAXON_ID=1461547 /ORGANISM="Stichococcus sp, Strain RCC1054" /LENGTH=207 /DNA_ID=CAMNT_0053534955 /DNA_START=254 /DNA_END=877 /DNA_ORIENTATION=+